MYLLNSQSEIQWQFHFCRTFLNRTFWDRKTDWTRKMQYWLLSCFIFLLFIAIQFLCIYPCFARLLPLTSQTTPRGRHIFSLMERMLLLNIPPQMKQGSLGSLFFSLYFFYLLKMHNDHDVSHLIEHIRSIKIAKLSSLGQDQIYSRF